MNECIRVCVCSPSVCTYVYVCACACACVYLSLYLYFPLLLSIYTLFFFIFRYACMFMYRKEYTLIILKSILITLILFVIYYNTHSYPLFIYSIWPYFILFCLSLVWHYLFNLCHDTFTFIILPIYIFWHIYILWHIYYNIDDLFIWD